MYHAAPVNPCLSSDSAKTLQGDKEREAQHERASEWPTATSLSMPHLLKSPKLALAAAYYTRRVCQRRPDRTIVLLRATLTPTPTPSPNWHAFLQGPRTGSPIGLIEMKDSHTRNRKVLRAGSRGHVQSRYTVHTRFSKEDSERSPRCPAGSGTTLPARARFPGAQGRPRSAVGQL